LLVGRTRRAARCRVAVRWPKPANLIAYSNTGTGDLAWYSTNGGSSWTQVTIPAPANTAASADRDPNIAFDREGVAYLAYLADDTVTAGLNHIVLSKSTDGGQTWTSADLASGVVYHPFIGIGESPMDEAKDNVYVAYRQDVTESGQLDSQIHVRASTDGGLTFPVNQVINDNSIAGIGNSSYCALQVGPGGRLYAAWEDSTNAPTYSNIRLDTSADGGATWGTDTTIIIGSASGTTGVTYNVGASGHYTIPAAPDQGILTVPSLAVARGGLNAGRVYVCYTFIAPGAGQLSTFAQTDIRLAYTDDLLSGSPTWTAKKVNDDTSAAKSQFHPWMTLDQDTQILYFSWSDTRNSASSNNTAQRYATFSLDGGATIRPNVRISDGTSNESTANANRDHSNYGDFNTHSSVGGAMNAAWTDNANQQSNDIYFDRSAINGQMVTATGGAGDDSYYLRLDPSGPFVQIWENRASPTGTPSFTILQSAMAGLTLAPGAGKNSITIDYTNGNPLLTPGLTLTASGDDTINVVGTAPTGTYSLNSGAGKFTLQSANPANTANLTLALTGGVVDVGSTLRLANLTVAAGATLNLPPSATPGGKVLVTDGLTLDAGTKVDVFNNVMVVEYGVTTVLPGVQSAVTTGFNAGGTPWGGAGITSSTAAGNPGAGVGYAEAGEVLGISPPATGMFLGQTVKASSVLVRYTLLGDATLDGVADFNDLVKLAQNYNVLGGGTWARGDFTYDGAVDFNDLVKMAQNYNTAPIPPTGAAAVPEPASFSLAFDEALASATESRSNDLLRSAPSRPKSVMVKRPGPFRAGKPTAGPAKNVSDMRKFVRA
jgi:hypothetical protein